jgi:hypothetical protein
MSMGYSLRPSSLVELGGVALSCWDRLVTRRLARRALRVLMLLLVLWGNTEIVDVSVDHQLDSWDLAFFLTA